MSLTIKAGTGYDAPWYVIDAPSQKEEREYLLGFAGLTEESALPDGRKAAEATLAELTIVVASIFQGLLAGGRRGGSGRQVSSDGEGKKPPYGGGTSSASVQNAKTDDAPSEDKAADDFRAQLDAAKSKDDLKVLAGRYGALLQQQPELLQAMKDRAAKL